MKLKNILNYIGLLLFFIFSLLGGLLKGYSVLLCLPISLLLTFAIFFLVKLMINKKKEIHSKIHETISYWTIYFLLMIAGGIASLHFITIQFIANGDLINNGNEKFKSIDYIIDEYNEQKEIVGEELYQEIQTKLNEYVNSSRSERKTLGTELEENYNIDQSDLNRSLKNRIKDVARNAVKYHFTDKLDNKSRDILNNLDNYYIEYGGVFDNMQTNYININKVYYGLDTLIENNKQRLEKHFYDVSNEFDYNIDVFNNFSFPQTKVNLDNFSKLRDQYSPWKYLLLYSTLHILILFPYLLTRKLGKKPLSYEDDESGRL